MGTTSLSRYKRFEILRDVSLLSQAQPSSTIWNFQLKFISSEFPEAFLRNTRVNHTRGES